MCGVFGAVGEIDNRLLVEAAMLAEARGPDGFGILADGVKIERLKNTDGLEKVIRSIKASVVVGHCRLRTSGKADLTHPIAIGSSAWIAHNGTVPEFERVSSQRGLSLKTGCDSELLGLLALELGLDSAVRMLVANVPHVACFVVGNEVEIVHYKHPLWVLELDSCVYWSSGQIEGSRLADGRLILKG